MKKGFTLIELLAVIVILSVILVIAVPQVMERISESKKSSYNSQMELIQKAASIYMTANSVSTVSLDTLITDGYIKSGIKNPETNTTFSTNVNINATTIDGGTVYETYEGPELSTGMIPVYYDDVNYVWKKADKYNNGTVKWYDYNNYQWANAVTVTSTNRATLQAAVVGTTIPMADINTMFVWIPRFKYRIPAGSGAREIEVLFESKYSSKSTGDAINTFYTHPAFTLGTEEVNGIWVGKFETTGTIASPTIRPDVQALPSQSSKSLYIGIKAMQNNSTYGFDNNSDIHMIKNTEWGAPTYLSQSKYGKYGNSSYVGLNKELYFNNSSVIYTGRSMGTYGGNGVLTPTNEYAPSGYYTYEGKCAVIYTGITECATGTVGQNITNKTLSYGASTTGTIYGIYDMSGGSWEYIMGMYMPNPIPATGISDQSGYSTTSTDSQYNLLTMSTKYYDRYLTNNYATGSIIGDATKEVVGWYGDSSNFFIPAYPWLVRGGYYMSGNAGGIFHFTHTYGGGNALFTSRVVITP